MFKHTALACLLAAALPACRDRAPQIVALPTADFEKPGQMTVTGQATLEISPDCADLTMTLGADDLRPGVATRGVEDKERALVAALDKVGVARADLKLSNLSLEPIYEPTASGWAQLRIHTYRAAITVTATTRDFAKIGAIMDAGATAGATSMSSAFRRSDLVALKKQVRDMALAAAKDKAKQTASALGIKLGRVISVGEAPNGAMWGNAYFPRMDNAAATMSSNVTLGGTLQALTLDVTVGYELAKEA